MHVSLRNPREWTFTGLAPLAEIYKDLRDILRLDHCEGDECVYVVGADRGSATRCGVTVTELQEPRMIRLDPF
jgi:hypothetical protein